MYPPPQDPYTQQQSGANAYPPQQPYPPQGNYPPQYPYAAPQTNIGPRNAQAGRAMIYGIISLILSLITALSQIGIAGLITGTFAIVYGIVSLNFARRFPNHPGMWQAIIAVVLGSLAWILIIISLISRSSSGLPY